MSRGRAAAEREIQDFDLQPRVLGKTARYFLTSSKVRIMWREVERVSTESHWRSKPSCHITILTTILGPFSGRRDLDFYA